MHTQALTHHPAVDISSNDSAETLAPSLPPPRLAELHRAQLSGLEGGCPPPHTHTTTTTTTTTISLTCEIHKVQLAHLDQILPILRALLHVDRDREDAGGVKFEAGREVGWAMDGEVG